MVLLFLACNGVPVESAITVKGQATIPKAIREHLRLKPGDRVKFFVHPDGTVVLLPKVPASALRGMLKTQRTVSVDEMNDAIARHSSPRKRGRRR
jgi:antitoxin PrlF